jgi:hypothetical protein
MVEAYKVGATFALRNLVSPELLKMAAEFAAVDAAAKAFQATLKSMSGVGGAGIFAGMSASATAMGDSFKYAAAEIDGVRARLNGLRQQSSGGFWASGTGSMVKSIGLGAAAYGGFEALKSGMSMEDTIARAMVAMGIQVGPDYMSSPMAGQIQNSIFDTSTKYGVKLGDTQDAALQAIRSLAPLSSDQRTALLPSILKFAGAEVLGKHGTTMDEATEAGIALAHQLRAYSPEQIEPLLGAFAKLSMASPQSLTQMARASSYYLPLLTAGLNMDPTALMGVGTVGSQMGLNTKSGTWLAQMFQAPFVADLTGTRQSARRKALQALGIVDSDGNAVTKDPIEFLKIIAAHAGAMSPEERMRDFVAGFGQQGARGAAIFTDPAVMKNILGLTAGLRSAPTPDALMKQYGNSPLVQFNQASEQMMKTLATLGETVMPAATTAINAFSGAVQGITWLLNLNNKIHDWMASKEAGVASFLFGGLSAAPPSAQQGSVVLNHSTMLDGRTLAQSTTEYQIDGLAQVSPSGNDYDFRMTPYMLGH